MIKKKKKLTKEQKKRSVKYRRDILPCARRHTQGWPRAKFRARCMFSDCSIWNADIYAEKAMLNSGSPSVLGWCYQAVLLDVTKVGLGNQLSADALACFVQNIHSLPLPEFHPHWHRPRIRDRHFFPTGASYLHTSIKRRRHSVQFCHSRSFMIIIHDSPINIFIFVINKCFFRSLWPLFLSFYAIFFPFFPFCNLPFFLIWSFWEQNLQSIFGIIYGIIYTFLFSFCNFKFQVKLIWLF